jgi:hypothetical protein
MKKLMIIATLITAFTAAAAHAGSYDTQCSSPDGEFRLNRFELNIDGDKPEFVSDTDGMFGSEEKDVQDPAKAVRLTAMGKQLVYKRTKLKDECDNEGQELTFVQKVKVANLKTGVHVKNYVVLCTYRWFTGHCF